MARDVVTIDFDFAPFNRAMLQYAEATVEDIITEVLPRVLLVLEREVKELTPVDKGRARASVHTILPGRSDGSFTYLDNGGNSFNGSAGVRSARDEGSVATNVDYFQYIENGSPTIRAHKPFARGLQKVQNLMVEGARRVMRENARNMRGGRR